MSLLAWHIMGPPPPALCSVVQQQASRLTPPPNRVPPGICGHTFSVYTGRGTALSAAMAQEAGSWTEISSSTETVRRRLTGSTRPPLARLL